MATITVDTDGGGDYSSLSAAEASLGSSLSEATIIECTGSTADTTGVEFNVTTTATYTLTVKAASGDEALISGWDNNRYHIERNLWINTEYFEFNGLQVHELRADSIHYRSIRIMDGATDKSSKIKNCLIYTTENSTVSNSMGIHCESGGYATIENCIVIGEGTSDHTNEFGINDSNKQLDIYNTIVINCYNYGIQADNVYSCIVYGCGDNLFNCNTIAYTGAEEVETGTGNFVLASTSSLFEDADNYDFTYLNYTSTGAIIDASNSSYATTYDMEGTARDSNPDCGPLEYVSSSIELVVTDCTYSLTFDTFGLTQNNVLSMNDNTYTYLIDGIDLIQNNILLMSEVDYLYTIDEIDLIQNNILSISENNYAYSIDGIDLIQNNVLSMNENDYSYIIDNITLSLATILEPNENNYSYSIDNINLTQNNILLINESDYLYSTDEIDLIQNNILSINDIGYLYSTDDIDLIEHAILQVNDTLKILSNDNLDLIQHNVLDINDTDFNVYIDNLDLIQSFILIVSDSLYNYIADNSEVLLGTVYIDSNAILMKTSKRIVTILSVKRIINSK